MLYPLSYEGGCPSCVCEPILDGRGRTHAYLRALDPAGGVMAGSAPVLVPISRGPARWMIAATLGLAGVVGVVATGSAEPVTPGAPAAPRSPAAAQQQLAVLIHQAGAVAERYNAATLDLTRVRVRQSRAGIRVVALTAELSALSGQAGQMAASMYRAVPLNPLTALLTSRNPRDFLAQLDVMDMVAHRRDMTMAALRRTKEQAELAQQQAHDAAGEAQRLLRTLTAQKASLDGQVVRQRALLASLTATQQRAVFDAEFGAGQKFPNVPASGAARLAVAAARSMLGRPYRVAGESPAEGFDCSGLMMWAWRKAGVDLPHSSAGQFRTGQPVPRDDLQPGDLVFFYSPVSHVGMYVGGGRMIHAPTTGDVVRVSSIDSMGYAGAVRVA